MPRSSTAAARIRLWQSLSDWPELSWDGGDQLHQQQLESFRRRLYAIFKIWRGRPSTSLGQTKAAIQPGLPEEIQVAINEWGVAMAACIKPEDEGKDLWLSAFHPVKGWSTPINLTRTVDPEIGYVQVAMSRRGDAVCVWRQGVSAHAGIWASRYDSEGGWGRPRRLDVPPAHGDTFAPVLALNRFGHALAAWQHSSTPELRPTGWTDTRQSSSIWVSSMRANGQWAPARAINQEPVSDASQLQLAIDNEGRGLAVWRQIDQAGTSIWYSRQIDEDDWTRPRPIRSNLPGSALEPCLKMNGHGDAMLVWVQVHGNRSQVWTCRFHGKQGWGEALALTESAVDCARQPRLSINEEGSAMLVWQSSKPEEEEHDLKTCFFLPDQGWGRAISIQSFGRTGGYVQPCVAISRSHHSIVIWQRIRNSRMEICARIHHPSYGWGAVRVLAQSDGGDADACALYTHVTAHMLAAWLRRDTLPAEPLFASQLTHPAKAFAQAAG